MSTCPVCESEFEYRSNKKFCSRNCKQKARAKPYLLHPKGTTCSKCGFEAEHRCQLDLDHIDGDKTNNCLENIQVLCANCHRLKTHLCGDSYPKAYRDNLYDSLNSLYESKIVSQPYLVRNHTTWGLDHEDIYLQKQRSPCHCSALL